MKLKLELDIDMDLLCRQKIALVRIKSSGKLSVMDNIILEGVTHLIDNIQDYAVNELGLSEGEVFPILKKRR